MKKKYKVESFNRDHRQMVAPQISPVARLEFGAHTLYKYDLRLCKPNADYIPPPTMHALEHILALELREQLDGVWDLSPMGCMTGFYLSVLDCPDAAVIRTVLRRCLQAVADAEEIPAANEAECGNYRFMDLDEAKKRARALLQTL
ncbi:MAG: S-ribosylhomocysteine lyase [Oscillospiraceae bacterium]|nr:S-ribosylhomocysteine lyase [Oscillospiraceae bacterium]